MEWPPPTTLRRTRHELWAYNETLPVGSISKRWATTESEYIDAGWSSELSRQAKAGLTTAPRPRSLGFAAALRVEKSGRREEMDAYAPDVPQSCHTLPRLDNESGGDG